MDFLSELWLFMRVRKKYWLMPIFLMTVVLGGLVVLSKGSAVAPFIYTLFYWSRPNASPLAQGPTSKAWTKVIRRRRQQLGQLIGLSNNVKL